MVSVRNKIKDAIDAIDPIGLLSAGAPSDEYDPEVDWLNERHEDMSPQLIRQCLEEFFEGLIITDEICNAIYDNFITS